MDFSMDFSAQSAQSAPIGRSGSPQRFMFGVTWSLVDASCTDTWPGEETAGQPLGTDRKSLDLWRFEWEESIEILHKLITQLGESSIL